MKKILVGFFILIISFITDASELQSIINQKIDDFDPSLRIGMKVVDLNTGVTLFERNPNDLLIPASNMKLFSNAAALLALGPNDQFTTTLSTDAKTIENGLLKGSLYLDFSGDPSLSQSHLNDLLNQLPNWGIRSIDGNIILISAHPNLSPHAPGQMAKDSLYGYGAPDTPLILDENRLKVTVNPGFRKGEKATIELSKGANLIPIDNQVQTSSPKNNCHVAFQMSQDNRLTVKGCVGLNQRSIVEELAIQNPQKYVADVIKSKLAALNIKLSGQVRLGTAPPSSLLMAKHSSKPIHYLMADTLKPSDNIYADSLFLHTASILNGGALLDWQQAETLIKKFLTEQTGIALDNAILVDGSGLSREDKLSVNQTVALLRFLYERFPLAYEYISALPVAGQDGTLIKRFKKPTQLGLLRAKTGTMTGIMSLSGYLYTSNFHTLAFAIFINKTKESKPKGSYRALIDDLCDFFLQQKPDFQPVARTETPYPPLAFQEKPTVLDEQLKGKASLRQLESALKKALQGQEVTVLYRGNQLVLKDHGASVDKIWSILSALAKKYDFGVALQSRTAPNDSSTHPHLLWIKSMAGSPQNIRVWTLTNVRVPNLNAINPSHDVAKSEAHVASSGAHPTTPSPAPRPPH